MHASVMQFGQEVLLPNHIRGKRILEVGALNVNGSLRAHCEQHKPSLYVGVDMQAGPGVDITCPAEDLTTLFCLQAFDMVICTEMLEHAQHWFSALRHTIGMLSIGGTMLLTTRSQGFPRHDYPGDYWRYDLHMLAEELRHFGMTPLKMRADQPDTPGVLYYLSRDGYAARTIPYYPADLHPYPVG